jgi:hypothetical protein
VMADIPHPAMIGGEGGDDLSDSHVVTILHRVLIRRFATAGAQ